MFLHLDWLALFFSVLGIWYNGNKNSVCWILWLVSNVLWVSHFMLFTNGQTSAVIMNVVFFLANIRGYRLWKTTTTTSTNQ